MARYSVTLMVDVVVSRPFVVGQVGDNVECKLTKSQYDDIADEAMEMVGEATEVVDITRIEDEDEE